MLEVNRIGSPRWLDAVVVAVWLALRPRRPRRRTPAESGVGVSGLHLPAMAGR
jgi:hypothetical protein